MVRRLTMSHLVAFFSLYFAAISCQAYGAAPKATDAILPDTTKCYLSIGDLDELLRQLNERDKRDATRRVGRMHKADDAVEVDTDGMTFEQVVDRLEEIVRSRQTAVR